MPGILRITHLEPGRLALEESLYHGANGYVGARASFEEGYPEGAAGTGGSYVNGFYYLHPILHPEKLYGFPETGERMPTVADALGIGILADGESVRLDPGRFADYERGLDIDRGVAHRAFTWLSRDGARLRVSIRRLASLARKELIAVELAVEALDRAMSIVLEPRVEGDVENSGGGNDPRLAGSALKGLIVVRAEARPLPASGPPGPSGAQAGGIILVESRAMGRDAGMAVLSLVESEAGPRPQVEPSADAHSAALSLGFRLGAGESFRLSRKNVYADSDRFPEGAAAAALGLASGLGGVSFEALEAEQAREAALRWSAAEASIRGDPKCDEGLRFSVFQLLQSAPAAEASSVPAKGLSGEGYEGHYFWDAEIYMAPFYTYTNPAAARRMLSCRGRMLEGAREHARVMGLRRGALFPWRTIAGRECSAYYPSGSAQFHINADIAYACWHYWEATGDLDFLERYGAEILVETARAWIEAGHFRGGEFRIDAVTGPDEYACVVDNSYYTNAMARFNLKRALEARAILAARSPDTLASIENRIGMEAEETRAWEEAARLMRLPYDEALGVCCQDDGFLSRGEWDFGSTPASDYPLLLTRHHLSLRRRQVCKQADVVLAHFLLPGISGEAAARASYDYYERRTTHDSSLSYAIFAAMAARLGDAEKALGYFEKAARLDLDDIQGNAKDGVHLASAGGAWLALAMGFGGLSFPGAVPSLAPILPERWSGLRFTIRFRGSTMRVEASRAEGGRVEASVELLSGPEIGIELYGERLTLRDRVLRPSPPAFPGP